MNNYQNFIGVDIGKDSLDFCLFDGISNYSFSVGNNIRALKKIFRENENLKNILLKSTLFCMEHTGIYNYHLLSFLSENKANIWLENPIHIKRSMGLIRGKTDKIDAQRIALFAFRNKDQAKLWQPQRPALQELKTLIALGTRLLKAIQSLEVPIHELVTLGNKAHASLLKKACIASVKQLKADLRRTNNLINDTIKADNQLSLLFNQITSVVGVGPVIAANMIVVEISDKVYQRFVSKVYHPKGGV